MELTEEQRMLQESVRAFVKKELPPGFARYWDERGEPPLETYKKFADAGFMGVGIPEEYGGSGGGIVEIAIMLMELSRGMMSFSNIVYRSAVHAAQGFLSYGTEEQKRTYLPQIVSGEKKFCFSLSEPQSGSDAASIRLRAERDGDEYVLTGEKMWSSFAGHADYVFLATRTSDEGPKHKGITMFLVDLRDPRITKTRIETLGDRASGTYLVHYDGVRVPASNMLGELNGGWKCLMQNLEKERMCAAPASIGVAEAILEQAIEYVNNRIQFGKPISIYQAIQHHLANVAVDIHVTKLLMWDTANRIAKGLPAKREASITKLYATEMLNRVAYVGMQVMGGMGYTMDCDMQLHFRNARLGTIGAGSSEIMRNVIAKDLGLIVS